MPRLKKKSHENLTAQNIQHVISLLNPTSSQTKAITKREACSILNISYNTTRLDKIIEDYHEQILYRARRVAQNRGKPARPDEIEEVIKEYLSGENVSNIAKRLYRSPPFIKSILEKIGVTQRVFTLEDKKSAAYAKIIAERFLDTIAVNDSVIEIDSLNVVELTRLKPTYKAQKEIDKKRENLFVVAANDIPFLTYVFNDVLELSNSEKFHKSSFTILSFQKIFDHTQ